VQRGAVYKFFQPQALKDAEMLVTETVEKLSSRMELSTAGCINLSNAYRSLANDIVTSFYFSTSNGLIDDDDYAAELHRSCGGFLRLLAFIRYFGVVGYILTSMSQFYDALLKPSQKLRSMLKYQQVSANWQAL
jgi:hypothetical protein